MYSGIIANTVAVIRGSYKRLPSTNTRQLTTCHRRCEAGTKAASSASIAHQYCTPVFNTYANLCETAVMFVLYKAKTRSGSLPAWRANKQTTVASALTLGSIMRNTLQKSEPEFVFEMTSFPIDFVSLPTHSQLWGTIP